MDPQRLVPPPTPRTQMLKAHFEQQNMQMMEKLSQQNQKQIQDLSSQLQSGLQQFLASSMEQMFRKFSSAPSDNPATHPSVQAKPRQVIEAHQQPNQPVKTHAKPMDTSIPQAVSAIKKGLKGIKGSASIAPSTIQAIVSPPPPPPPPPSTRTQPQTESPLQRLEKGDYGLEAGASYSSTSQTDESELENLATPEQQNMQMMEKLSQQNQKQIQDLSSQLQSGLQQFLASSMEQMFRKFSSAPSDNPATHPSVQAKPRQVIEAHQQPNQLVKTHAKPMDTSIPQAVSAIKKGLKGIKGSASITPSTIQAIVSPPPPPPSTRTQPQTESPLQRLEKGDYGLEAGASYSSTSQTDESELENLATLPKADFHTFIVCGRQYLGNLAKTENYKLGSGLRRDPIMFHMEQSSKTPTNGRYCQITSEPGYSGQTRTFIFYFTGYRPICPQPTKQR